MVMDRIAQVAKEAEQKLGLPPLSKFTESLERFPDAKQLKLIKEVLEAADKVSRTAPELDKVISLIRELNSISPEKLSQLEKLLRRVEKLMKTAPDELLSFIASLSEEK